MALALDVGTRSEGAFDVTVGPLVERWGFGAHGAMTKLPTDTELDALRGRLGHDHLGFDPKAGTLRKDAAALRVDLSAIAKGYGVDQAAAALREAGHTDFMVEVGGEIRTAGATEAGRAWRLAVEKPNPTERAIYEVVELRDRAMATSGDYRNFTEVGGKRYSHTIDPTTGRPVTHRLASVSVVAPTCAEADAMATALNVLGPERGLALAEREGLPALFLVGTPDDLEALATDAWVQLRVQ
jgi:thiamine biosynthesis lipoprotein